MQRYDLVVIGAGPGGYVGAIRAAQNGLRVAVIEKKAVGGTCLNVGCIPSKNYLEHAHWALTFKEAEKYGFTFSTPSFDYARLVNHKNQVIKTLQGGIQHLFKQHAIDYIVGEAIVEDGKLLVNNQEIIYEKLLLATGSHPFVPPINGIETVDYLTTDTFFDLTTLPSELAIIGGGVIAVELAFAMQPLGTKVSLIEVAPDILLTEDPEARQLIKQQLLAMGIKVITKAKIERVSKEAIYLADQSISFSHLLVATGRKPNLELAKQLNVTLDEQGRFVKVNPYYQTNQKNIYAIGDLIGGYQLAHAASAEALKAVAAICKQPTYPVLKEEVPRCIYTSPEVASFGLNEQEAKEQYQEITIKKVPFAGNGKAIATNHTQGFIKLIMDQQYHQILGAVIVGTGATEMIHTLLATKKAEGTIDELADMTFAHPTLSEVIGEGANGLLGQAIHG
ncbi:MAG TPA: dihydrolipoyl dehydrogenase [Enterococcus columbae]|nr:dihydrolipoyl dehydrogenase [Enterococcus columbae]